MLLFGKSTLRRLLYVYAIIVLLLVTLPLNSTTTTNDIFVLYLRADYLFHILMFLPWMFFHNTAAKNLPLRCSFSFAAKTKEIRKKSQQLIAHQQINDSTNQQINKSTQNKSTNQRINESTAKSLQLSWLLLGLLFASASEGLQYLLPYRAFNINDLMANMLGVLAGYFLAVGIKNLTRKLSH